MIQVEYLLVVEKADAFCDTADALNKLLDVDARLTVSDGQIWCEEETKYSYSVQSGEILNKGQRYFQLVFSLDEEASTNNVDALAKMLAVVRTVLHRLSSNLDILRDDVSTFYSELGYKKVHQIENLMRRLITKFMVVNVGADWVKESTPKPVKEALDASKRKGWSSNVLDEIDFIVLSHYLLHSYCTGPRDKALTELETVDSPEKLEAFKTRFCLSSNWTRYFSGIVNCEAEFLRKRWEQLYELRCKIAHNALINKNDFERIQQLVSELEEPLATAIEKIGEVEVPEDEVDQVVQEADAATETSSQVRKLRAEGFPAGLTSSLIPSLMTQPDFAAVSAASSLANMTPKMPDVSSALGMANMTPKMPDVSSALGMANMTPKMPDVSSALGMANMLPKMPDVSSALGMANMTPKMPDVSSALGMANMTPKMPDVSSALGMANMLPKTPNLMLPSQLMSQEIVAPQEISGSSAAEDLEESTGAEPACDDEPDVE